MNTSYVDGLLRLVIVADASNKILGDQMQLQLRIYPIKVKRPPCKLIYNLITTMRIDQEKRRPGDYHLKGVY